MLASPVAAAAAPADPAAAAGLSPAGASLRQRAGAGVGAGTIVRALIASSLIQAFPVLHAAVPSLRAGTAARRQVRHCGMLLKRNRKLDGCLLRNWDARFFLLDGEALSYAYRRPKPGGAYEPAATFSLSGLLGAELFTEGRFRVSFKERALLLEAESEAEAAAWVAALRQVTWRAFAAAPPPDAMAQADGLPAPVQRLLIEPPGGAGEAEAAAMDAEAAARAEVGTAPSGDAAAEAQSIQAAAPGDLDGSLPGGADSEVPAVAAGGAVVPGGPLRPRAAVDAAGDAAAGSDDLRLGDVVLELSRGA